MGATATVAAGSRALASSPQDEFINDPFAAPIMRERIFISAVRAP
ncbi:hypothetical protein [Mycobacterium sp.]|nr:hypothetical protein [Mycobacterium sp.]